MQRRTSCHIVRLDLPPALPPLQALGKCRWYRCPRSGTGGDGQKPPYPISRSLALFLPPSLLGHVPIPLPEERHRRRRAEASVLVSQRVFRGLLHLRVGDAVVQSLQPGGEPRGL